MKRKECRACKSKNLKLFLDLGKMPLAGGFLKGLDAMPFEKVYPLQVYVCQECSLVQILEIIDPEILFQDYSFSSSTVKPLIQHFKEYAIWLKTKYNPKFVVEFGCNDGVLLKQFEHLGIKNCGIDVSENITEIARNDGLDVITGYFDEPTAELIKKRLGLADLVTGSNAFAHNDQPEIILKAAKRILNPDGYLCLEVMYVGDLLELLQWDTLYHEHLTFYCLSTLSALLNRHGFHVIDAELITMHGGSLRVVATQDSQKQANTSVSEILAYEKEKDLDDPNTPVITMANLLSSKYRIWILSGRSDVTHQATVDWLAKNGVDYDHLVMRPQNHLYMPDNDLKQMWLDNIGKDNVAMVFDDRQQVVDMWRKNGLTTFQVADGDF